LAEGAMPFMNMVNTSRVISCAWSVWVFCGQQRTFSFLLKNQNLFPEFRFAIAP
jgi:hypothetical protein